LLLIVVVGWAPGAGADGAGRDSAAVVARSDSAAAATHRDSVAAGTPAPRRAAARDSSARSLGFQAPRWVMLRSLVIPGWGQLDNGSWFKALAVAGGEISLGIGMLSDLHALDRDDAEVQAARAAGDAEAELAAVNAYNDHQAALVSNEWLLGGLIVYALADAYVDAHFRSFKVEFEHDPALPPGVKVPGSTKLALRWSF
jgi:hypothetical protein